MTKTLLICALIYSLSACASGHHEPFEGKQSPVRDISGVLTGIRTAVEASAYLSLKEIGKVDKWDNRCADVGAAVYADYGTTDTVELLSSEQQPARVHRRNADIASDGGQNDHASNGGRCIDHGEYTGFLIIVSANSLSL